MRAFTIKCYTDENKVNDWSAKSPTTDEIVDGLRQFYPIIHPTVVEVVPQERYSELLNKMNEVFERVARYCVEHEANDDFVADMVRFGMPDPRHKDYAVDMTVSFRVRFNLSDVSSELDASDIESAICEQLGLVLRKDVDYINLLDVRHRIDDFDVDDAGDDWEIEIEEV